MPAGARGAPQQQPAVRHYSSKLASGASCHAGFGVTASQWLRSAAHPMQRAARGRGCTSTLALAVLPRPGVADSFKALRVLTRGCICYFSRFKTCFAQTYRFRRRHEKTSFSQRTGPGINTIVGRLGMEYTWSTVRVCVVSAINDDGRRVSSSRHERRARALRCVKPTLARSHLDDVATQSLTFFGVGLVGLGVPRWPSAAGVRRFSPHPRCFGVRHRRHQQSQSL